MPIDFEDLIDDEESSVLDPRDIFLTLDRDKAFAFPRDIQTEVMKEWFKRRAEPDIVVKLNVGSGKTLVGLLILQSCLHENVGPAIYIAPDKQLVDQVLAEAAALGLDATDDPRDTSFQSGQCIAVTTVHRLFNGRSIFGVGAEGIKLRIGSIVVDDVHACIATVSDQFRIELPNTHAAYQKILKICASDLKRQSHARFLDVDASDPRVVMEVPFWTWIDKHEQIVETLHAHRDDDELMFSYPLLREILPQCRCFLSGQRLQIEPSCPPTDLVRAFQKAKRRIYMTASLADDSVLVTHFGADAHKLSDPIVPVSSQSMGERMILMPQELNPSIDTNELRSMLSDIAKKENVVVIVPSRSAAEEWESVSDQTLLAGNIIDGIDRLKQEHVGLTVLVNRYDGIDLPHSACRVLAIVGLPEIASSAELSDIAVLGDSESGLRRQMQRIEQGMGRGVRSNDDYCVVFLIGSKLTRRVLSPEGAAILTPATRAQLDLSRKVAKRLAGEEVQEIRKVVDQCLGRDPGWIKVSKKSLLKAEPQTGLNIDQSSVTTRRTFDMARAGDHKAAADAMRNEASGKSGDEKAWLLAKCAALEHQVNPAEAQKTLLKAYKLNSNVLKPLRGVAYQRLSSLQKSQANAVQEYHQSRFLEATDRLLYTNELADDLAFQTTPPDRFEAAVDSLATFIGISAHRPEKLLGVGPDNLWALSDGTFFVIECKNRSTSEKGISKTDMGQIDQSMTWFSEKYPAANATAIIIHPHRILGEGATAIPGMRVITEEKLKDLRVTLAAFAQSLGDEETLNKVQRVSELIAIQGLNPSEFLKRFTSGIK